LDALQPTPSTVLLSAQEADIGRAPGRPRNPAVDQAILRAALELFIDHGDAGASIEKIAKRAGVAKTSIYRRWSSREALLAQAIEVARNATGYTVEVVDRTPPRDFIKLLIEACEVVARPDMRKLAARLIGSLPDCPTLMAVYRETYYFPRRQAFVQALERAGTAGMLPRIPTSKRWPTCSLAR
jgi:AcrR family transcriptional regulator